MFCPKCATANSDQAKFCRACGTNLEGVALALEGQLVPPAEAGDKQETKPGTRSFRMPKIRQLHGEASDKGKKPRTREDWLEKWGKGVRETIQGAILLAVYLLVGFVLLGVLPDWRVDYVLMWMILAGGMAIWGIITLARGIGHIVESKPILREMERLASGQPGASTTPLLSDARGLRIPPGALDASEQALPPSVTEHTTESLSEHRTHHPDVVLPEKQGP